MIKMKLHLKMAEKRITQSELASITGIRQPTISAYYNDTWKTISREHLDSLCDFFKCKIEDLIVQIPATNRQVTIYDYVKED
ncbi:helix-turn-helix transcriptional regulator [Clostridium sp. CF012]|uniref:helix-turn-helix domain-containing protein n=1 Tax=Clostridium sp. CF012 TaxID=2843319 RepID=UPI001C0DC9C4|nr:helix-turn-helix transcriptional regulator [Clostridium sp. CF012]MBU3145022.1 helix-turn-helix transcriptional regulator [Clostridium sp. CF012]